MTDDNDANRDVLSCSEICWVSELVFGFSSGISLLVGFYIVILGTDSVWIKKLRNKGI